MDSHEVHLVLSKVLWATIHDLPAEVLFLVFRCHLHGQDVARCMRVCRRFADLVRFDVYLQYRIELAKNGMIDGPSGTLPVAERLQRLRRYSSNFRNGIFDHECNTDHSEYLRHLRSLKCRGRSRTAGVTTVLHLNTDSGPTKFYLAVFIDPSTKSGIQSRRVVVPVANPGGETGFIGGWIIDHAQDLLVTVEFANTETNTRRVFPFAYMAVVAFRMLIPPMLVNYGTCRRTALRLCSWSRSQVSQIDHPAAAVPHLQISPPPGYPGDPGEVSHIGPTIIEGSYVIWTQLCAVIDHAYKYSIHICNWRTGEMVSRIDLGEKHQSFVLLDDTYVLILPHESDSDSDSEPDLSVYSLAPSLPNRPICSLQLPSLTLGPGEHISNCEISTSRHSIPEAHFRDDPSMSMVVLTYSLKIGAPPLTTMSRTCYLLIPYAALLAQIRTVIDSNSNSDSDSPLVSPAVPVPWQDWGALASLRLWVPIHPHDRHISDRVSLVPCGSRMPIVTFDDAGCTRASVYVFDINPLVARQTPHILAAQSESGAGAAPAPAAIVGDVEAALPGIVDPGCSAGPFVVYRFGIPLPEVEHFAWRMIQAVRMSMTGFTVTFGDGPYEMDHTWTV